MSLGRPWENEYRNLLAEAERKWGEKLSEEEYARLDEARWGILGPTTYPSFFGRRAGEEVAVSLSADILELAVCRPVGALLVIRPEGFVDRFLKRFLFWWEFQTGNPAFDCKYYVADIRKEADKTLVRDARFQRLVEELEPFSSITLRGKNARCSFQVENESQFTVGYVDDRLGRLSRLAQHAAEVIIGSPQ
jgi:hypothetical protein